MLKPNEHRDLLNFLSNTTGLSLSLCKRILDDTCYYIILSLKSGRAVNLPKLGVIRYENNKLSIDLCNDALEILNESSTLAEQKS